MIKLYKDCLKELNEDENKYGKRKGDIIGGMKEEQDVNYEKIL